MVAVRLGSLMLLAALSLCAAPRTVTVNVTADIAAKGYAAANALDGDPTTMWHTPWGAAETKLPHELTIDLGAEVALTGFRYQRRLDGANGCVGEYAVMVSPDGTTWGEPVVQGTFAQKSGAETSTFPQPLTARFVRWQALSEINGRPWTSVAELELLADGVLFRAPTALDASHHGTPEPPIPRKRQGPDTSTLAGAMEMARITLAFV